jgi:predicted AAA+ superfamily ATPase
MRQVSQSLAGRAALMTLYPCSVSEVDLSKKHPRSNPHDVADWILRGGYPELRANPKLERRRWCGAYIRLYVERDVRNLLNVGDITAFEKFIRLTALRTGQILNISDLARDAEVSPPTAKRWLSILEESYIIYLLRPYYANLSKRLIKSPKIYFTDTALASYLMGIHNEDSLMEGPQFGPLFETAAIMEHIKYDSYSDNSARFSYFRTKDGIEIDLLIEDNAQLYAREMKTTRTLMPRMAENLIRTEELLKKSVHKTLLAPIEKAGLFSHDVETRPWQEVGW